MSAKRSLPSWVVWALAALGFVGLFFGLSGIIMTGSFAVAGVPEAATLAYWKRIQLWYDALTVGSLALLGVCAVSVTRRVVGARRRSRT